MFKRFKVKKGDTVKVISGGNRGKEGTVLAVDRKKDRVVVEGVNIVTKHVKPSPANPQGGVTTTEAGMGKTVSIGDGGRATAARVSLATTAAQHAVLQPQSLPWHSGEGRH